MKSYKSQNTFKGNKDIHLKFNLKQGVKHNNEPNVVIGFASESTLSTESALEKNTNQIIQGFAFFKNMDCFSAR